MKLCPDLRGIIQSFKVKWNNFNNGGMKVFIKMVPACILQFYKYGETIESFYDDLNFPLDSDLNGNQYLLNSNADNMTRSTVLYHPRILVRKRGKIRQIAELKNSTQDKVLSDTQQLFVVNKQCGEKLVNLTIPGSKEEYSDCNFELITIDILYKCSAYLLTTFMKVRTLKDLTEPYILPNKGNPNDVRAGNVDKKQKDRY